MCPEFKNRGRREKEERTKMKVIDRAERILIVLQETKRGNSRLTFLAWLIGNRL